MLSVVPALFAAIAGFAHKKIVKKQLSLALWLGILNNILVSPLTRRVKRLNFIGDGNRLPKNSDWTAEILADNLPIFYVII